MRYTVTDVTKNCSEITSESFNTVTPNILQVFTSLLFPIIFFIVSSFIRPSRLHTDTHLFLNLSIFARPSLFPYVLCLFFLLNLCVFLRIPIDNIRSQYVCLQSLKFHNNYFNLLYLIPTESVVCCQVEVSATS